MTTHNLLTALNLCYRLFKFRLRTEFEIRAYLKRKSEKYKFTDKDIAETLENLKEQGLINDEEFVDWFVQSRVANKQKSEWVLKKELLQHGAAKDLVEKYFLENQTNEEDLACKALERKWVRLSLLSPQIRFKKAFSFLSNRGFSFYVIKKAVAKLEGKS